MSYNYSDCYPYGYFLNGSGPDYTLDPDSTDLFTFNWAADLQDDTIVTSDIVLLDGVTEVETTQEGNVITVLLSGAVEGRVYRVTNRVTTASGRTIDKTIRILGQDD